MFAMRCDRAGCLTEASTGSITEEEGETKSTDFADRQKATTGNKSISHEKAQEAQTNCSALPRGLFVFCVICEICGLEVLTNV